MLIRPCTLNGTNMVALEPKLMLQLDVKSKGKFLYSSASSDSCP